MDSTELSIHYRQAIQLVRIGRYGEALHLLEEVDAERPGTKGVIYAMAVCKEMLGRAEEALELCEQLISKYDDPKARIIKARIEHAAKQPELPQIDIMSSLGLDDPGKGIPKLAVSPEPTKHKKSSGSGKSDKTKHPSDKKKADPIKEKSKGKAKAPEKKKKEEKKGWFFGFGKK